MIVCWPVPDSFPSTCSCLLSTGERLETVKCRMRRSPPPTGAVRSDADTVPKIVDELLAVRHSERQLRVIDHDQGRVHGNQEAAGILLSARPASRICTARKCSTTARAGRFGVSPRLARRLRGSGAHSVRAASRNRSAGPIDFSPCSPTAFAPDREQGITIDVATGFRHRPSQVHPRSYSPGHEQYHQEHGDGCLDGGPRDPLVDRAKWRAAADNVPSHRASRGGREHFDCSPGHEQMDLVAFDAPGVFHAIRDDFADLSTALAAGGDSDQRPARRQRDGAEPADAVVRWPEPAVVLSKSAEIQRRPRTPPSAYRSQLVIRPDHRFRDRPPAKSPRAPCVSAIELASGPRLSTRVDRIVTWDGDLDAAVAPYRPSRSRLCSSPRRESRGRAGAGPD